MKRIGALLLFASVLTACQDADLTRPDPAERLSPDDASADIVEEGGDHFFFLPPLDDPDANGTFNPNLLTEVEICEWDPGAKECLAAPIQSFSSDEIRVQGEQYHVNWQIRRTAGIQLNTVYAVRVLTRGVQLGFAEVVIGRNARQADEAASQLGVIGLVRSQTLPIRYRAELGIFCDDPDGCIEASVTADESTTVTNEDETFGATIPEGAVPDDVGEVTLIIEEIELEPGETCLAPLGLNSTGQCLSYTTEPELANGFDDDVVVGICFDRSAVPNPENYLIHRFDPDDPNGTVEALPSAATPFLDCSGSGISMNDAGPVRRLAHAGWRALAGLIAPRPLRAGDEGFGGVTSRFSNFQWAEAVQVTAVSRTEQDGVAGGEAPAQPTVLVEQAHDGSDPVSGVDVEFEFTDPNGNVSTAVATSDANGVASVAWPLSSTTGLHTADATAPGAPAPASFETEAGTVEKVDAGEFHACALLSTGGILCWGAHVEGRLGDGSSVQISPDPVQVAGNTDYVDMSAGRGHTCGVAATGEVLCWGLNSAGQLGDGGTTDSNVPVQVSSNESFQRVAAGFRHTCALTTTGDVRCWGGNDRLQLGANPSLPSCTLGQNSVPCSTTPVTPTGAPSFTDISTGLSSTCGLDGGGNAWCWGWNVFGALGNGSLQPAQDLPNPVATQETFATLHVGGAHACGLTSAGTAWCWGGNLSGQLGIANPQLNQSPAPVQVQSQLAFRAIAASQGNDIFGHTCAIATDGSLHCWGADEDGQLATSAPLQTCTAGPFSVDCAQSPVPSASGITFGDVVDANRNYTCGLAGGGEVFCWGQNDTGQLGDGSTTNRATPVQALP